MKRSTLGVLSVVSAFVAVRVQAQTPTTNQGVGSGEAASGSSVVGDTTGSDGSGSADGSARPQAGSGVDSGSAKTDAASANLNAQESLPQITAARGGSLGIPSSLQTAGLHASVDAKLFADQASADAFAQLAGLPINENLSVDVLAQSVEQDVQRFVLDGVGVHPELYTAQLSSAGLRLRYRSDGVLIVSRLQTDECVRLLRDTLRDKAGNDVSIVRLIREDGFGGADVKNGTNPVAEKPSPKARSLDARIAFSKSADSRQQARDALRDATNAANAAKRQRLDAEKAANEKLAASTLKTASDADKAQLKAAQEELAKTQAAEEQANVALAVAQEAADAAGSEYVTLTDRDGIDHLFRTADVEAVKTKLASACHLNEFVGLTDTTWVFGAHVLRRSSNAADGTASSGAALELIRQHSGINSSWYVGGSFEYLNHALDKDTQSQFDFVSFHAARLSAGYEYRASHSSDGTDLLPRIGIYGVASAGWWRDKYTFASVGGTIDSDVYSTELEAGVYASGKFTNNFTGMLALRALKPFGDFNQGATFILSLIPAVSAGK